MHIYTTIIDENKSVGIKVSIDGGAQGIFMNEKFAKKHQLPLLRLEKEITVSNVDNTLNMNGPII